jgi:hypothetical protein
MIVAKTDLIAICKCLLASPASPISSFGRALTKVDATPVFEGRSSSTFTVNDAGVLQFDAPSLNRALVARETLLFAGDRQY